MNERKGVEPISGLSVGFKDFGNGRITTMNSSTMLTGSLLGKKYQKASSFLALETTNW